MSKSLIWIVCTIIAASAFQASGMEGPSDSALFSYGLTDQQFKKRLKEYIGIPYRKGGMSKKGMDCSGFVRTVYTNFFDIELPNSAMDQFGFAEFKKIETPEMQPGDLIFFANNKKKRISHVGVYLSDRQFIHASSSQGVTVSSLDDRYWKKRFVGSKRHKALNSKPDYDKIVSESILEIPIHQNGTFTGYARDEFRFNSFGTQNDLARLDNDSFEIRDLNYSLFYLYEIGYGHTVFDGYDVNLSAIHENFDVYTAWPGFEPSARNMSYPLDGSSPDTAYRLGINLNDNLQFSITGQHDRRTAAAYGLQKDSLPMQYDISNIFMMFDLSY